MHTALEPLRDPAFARALIDTVAVAIVAGAIGTFIVLRGIGFLGDALAHAIFPGVVTHTFPNPGCFASVCSALRTWASRNGWPVQNVCIEMPNTRDCFCESRSISSN